MDLLLDIIASVCLIAGAFLVFVGGFGVMRMPDFYTRMHAASLTDTGGAALILIGLMLQGGLTLAPVKLIAIFLFLFLTSPTASYALANAALLSGLKPMCRNETGSALPTGQVAATGVPDAAKPAGKPAAKKTATKKIAPKNAVKKKAVKKPAGKSARKSS